MMGVVLSKRRFLRRGQSGHMRPFIYCCEIDDVTNEAFSLNVPIAVRLADVSPLFRSIRLESCLVAALHDLRENVVIRDIDVLLNPTYEIDVVSLICNAFRKHKFDLVWPGRFEDNQLVYAEKGYPDYKAFDIDRYDITCIY